MKIYVINQTRAHLSAKDVRRFVARVFTAMRQTALWQRDLPVSMVFVPQGESRRLNRIFLGKNRPANVLSFDYGDYAEIVLTPDIIRKEAKRQAITFGERTMRLIVHGAVHLAGLHHERSAAMGNKVLRLEKKLLERLGINPQG